MGPIKQVLVRYLERLLAALAASARAERVLESIRLDLIEAPEPGDAAGLSATPPGRP